MYGRLVVASVAKGRFLVPFAFGSPQLATTWTSLRMLAFESVQLKGRRVVLFSSCRRYPVHIFIFVHHFPRYRELLIFLRVYRTRSFRF